MERICPRCEYSIQYDRDAPKFCSNCGASLSTTDEFESTIDAATRPPADSKPSSASFHVDPEGEDWIRPGAQVGPYVIDHQLGRGGMGVVYRATHEATGKQVAIKFLNQNPHDSPKAAERFHRESQIAASISNPRSTFVFSSGDYANRRFIVMELMPGDTLKDLVKQEGPLPVGRAVDLILDVIAGIQSAHRRGIIHRDIKPSNCFLDHDGRVKIGDYGLSKSFDSDVHLTKTGTFMGTLQFAAPEQIKGVKVDERTDIYAIGATLYYLLAGKAPYEGDAAQVIAGIASDPVPDIRNETDNVAKRLGWIIMQMLEKDPKNRPPGLAEVRRQLLPFATRGANTADIGRRFAAFFIDYGLANVVLVSFFVGIMMFVGMILGFKSEISNQNNVSIKYNSDSPSADKSKPNLNSNISQPRSDSQTDGRVSAQINTPPRKLRGFDYAVLLVAFLIPILYFAVSEGLWGRTIGKLMFGMRTVDEMGGPPGIPRALLRSLMLPGALLAGGLLLPFFANGEMNNPNDSTALHQLIGQVGATLLSWVLALCLLIPARTKNGFQGVHGKITGTRVVRIGSSLESQGFEVPVTLPTVFNDRSILGESSPLKICGIINDSQPKIFLAKDDKLDRFIWLVEHPRSEVPESRILINRPRRQRVLDYDVPDNWTCMEAVTGSPLIDVFQKVQRIPWQAARLVLEELIDELIATIGESSMPEFVTPENIWLDEEGNIKLVDYCPKQPDKKLEPLTGTDEERAVDLVIYFINLVIQKERVPGHVWDFFKQCAERKRDKQTLLWIRDELYKSEKLPSQWKWDDRLGSIAASTSTESTAIWLVAFTLALLLHYVFGFGAIVVGSSSLVALMATTFLLGYRFDGGPVFKLCGVEIRNRNHTLASKFKCGLRNVVAWFPSSLLFSFFVVMLTGFIMRQNQMQSVEGIWVMVMLNLGIMCGVVVIAVGFVQAILFPNRSIPDLIFGTTLARK